MTAKLRERHLSSRIAVEKASRLAKTGEPTELTERKTGKPNRVNEMYDDVQSKKNFKYEVGEQKKISGIESSSTPANEKTK